jgi:hypothetical protein
MHLSGSEKPGCSLDEEEVERSISEILFLRQDA